MRLPGIPRLLGLSVSRLKFENTLNVCDIIPTMLKSGTFVTKSVESMSLSEFVNYILENDFIFCIKDNERYFLAYGYELRVDAANHAIFVPYVCYDTYVNTEIRFPYNIEVRLKPLHVNGKWVADELLVYSEKNDALTKLTGVSKLKFQSVETANALYRLWVDYTVHSVQDVSLLRPVVSLESRSQIAYNCKQYELPVFSTATKATKGYFCDYIIRHLLLFEHYRHYNKEDLEIYLERKEPYPNYFKLQFDASLYSLFMLEKPQLLDLEGLDELGITRERLALYCTDMPTFYIHHYYCRNSRIPIKTYDGLVDVKQFFMKEVDTK